MKIALASEVFPPRAGGAGWSTRALALGLREHGHEVVVFTTSPGPDDEEGIPVKRLAAPGRKRFAQPRAFARALRGGSWDVVHAQHSLAALGAVAGFDAARVAVTIRDHWPVCFWSTRITGGALCPGCGTRAMTRCVRDHVTGWPSLLKPAAIPYMQLDLAAKRRALSRVGANLAVSESVAAELRSAGLPRVEVLPNVVDVAETLAHAGGEPGFPLPERFLLFVGKLEENKGARALVPAVAAAKTGLPLVILGEGTLTHAIKFDATAAGVPLVHRGWAHRDDVLRAMARATALVFPSLWPEPLSRVLLEALALGTPVAAMDTGGTREILEHGRSGLVVDDVASLGDAVARIAGDDALRAALAEGARLRAAAFSPARLIPRYEAVYRRLAG